MLSRLCLLPLLGIAACSPDYPFDKPGTWHLGATGSNDANLRTMIVNPRDLVGGTGERRALASEAAPPVHRLLTGQRYPLPASDVLQVELSGQQPPQSQGGQNVGQ
jgi:hypothetical protein